MLDFQPIKPENNELFWTYYEQFKNQNAENSFANLCCYSFLYQGEYCVIDDNLLTRIHFDYGKQLCYYMPLGNRDFKEVTQMIIDDSIAKKYQLNFIIEAPEIIENIFPQQFDIISNRNMFDYLYLREDLQFLKGKKYQPKRNHINQFVNQYAYTFKEIHKEDREQCMQMLSVWREQEMNISPEYKRDYDDEKNVIEYFFKYFNELRMYGGAIMLDDKMIAFSLGSPINADTFDTNIEKADRNYMGAYAIINKEMAAHMPENFKYINREEDKGIMGLRQAKLSYKPLKLIEKYVATYKNNTL